MMMYIPDPLFRPVGHTDEASASSGGNSRLYSPFSAAFDPEGAARQTIQEQQTVKASRLTTQANPRPAAVRRLLADPAAGLRSIKDIKTSVTTIPMYLGLAGLIVNKDWTGAQSLCQAIMKYLKQAAGTGRVKTGQGTYYEVLTVLNDYFTQLRKGQEPYRTLTIKKGGRVTKINKTIWNSVYDCCLAVSGNVKLPFCAYSEAPIVTCPGAGGVSTKYGSALTGGALGVARVDAAGLSDGCGNWCYSVKALAYPGSMARMMLLTLGMSIDPQRHVDTVVQRMIDESKVDQKPHIMRLFVDGDFRDQTAVEAWMRGCRELSLHGILVYGYSKSWVEMLAVHKDRGAAFWPPNYVLNLSSGSLHDEATRQKMMKLPIVRGDFVAVDPLFKMMEKTYELKEGRDKGARMAYAVYAAYLRSKKSAEDAIARLKGVKGAGSGKAKKTAKGLLKAVENSLHTRLRRYAPDVYSLWVEYEEAHKNLKKKIGAYNTVVKKRASTALKHQKKAVGATALVPGQALQALTWRFLTLVQGPGEWACPIDCGRCPMAAIKIHDRVIKGLLSSDSKKALQDIQRTFQKALSKPYFPRHQRIHACGDIASPSPSIAYGKKGLRIIIGVH